MKAKSLLVGSVSFAVISSAAAAAEVNTFEANNFVDFEQRGASNSAEITQSGQRNTVGLRAAGSTITALQSGDDNVATILQQGDDNEIGAVGSGMQQRGDQNSATLTQIDSRNIIGTLRQTASDGATAEQNAISVTQRSISNGTPELTANIVSGISQTNTGGAVNSITITQTRADGTAMAAAGHRACEPHWRRRIGSPADRC